LEKLYEIIERRISANREINEALLLTELESAEASQLTVILEKPESMSKGEKIIIEYINKIRSERLKAQIPDGDMLLEIKRLRENKTPEVKSGK